MPGTDRRRIYAIGDIHGCLDLLDGMLERIADDLDRRPHDKPLIIFLGDYGDRGPDTRGVIDRLIELEQGPVPTAFLLGNHDFLFLEYLDAIPDAETPRMDWLNRNLGGTQTLASYGVRVGAFGQRRAREDFAKAVPEAHVAFLKRAERLVELGDYIFAHAGIQPGVPVASQQLTDLIWIREPFLSDPRQHPGIVVHGHTIVERVENRGNRIAVDTGAVFTGNLSCVVLDGPRQELLTDAGPVELPVIR
ncbi:metallophosphoesterase [Halovulum sp. GXIMD14794]